MYDVACCGIIVADLITSTVDDIPEKGKLSLVDSIEICPGGNAFTASANLKKMGLNPALIGMVGKDYFGKYMLDIIRNNGIPTDGVAISDKNQTSASVAMIASDGERTFLHNMGADAEFSLKDVNWDIIAESKMVFVTGTFVLRAFDGEDTMLFLKKCKEMGKVTCLDTSWDSNGQWGGLLYRSMPYIDVFMPSFDEAQQLACGESDCDKIADFFFEKGVGKVIIKLGKRGSYARESKNEKGRYFPTYDGIKKVDTTGAGDSFCSGFLGATSRGWSFYDAVMFGNVVGTHCVMGKGATSGIKSFEEMKAFLEESSIDRDRLKNKKYIYIKEK